MCIQVFVFISNVEPVSKSKDWPIMDFCFYELVSPNEPEMVGIYHIKVFLFFSGMLSEFPWAIRVSVVVCLPSNGY